MAGLLRGGGGKGPAIKEKCTFFLSFFTGLLQYIPKTGLFSKNWGQKKCQIPFPV